MDRPHVPDWLSALVDDLAADVCGVVAPNLGQAAAKGLAGRAEGGDTTFSIDVLAEDRVSAFLEERGEPVALYSEDQGLLAIGTARAEFVLVVDPIGGTRPAAAGFEAACVSVAAAVLTGDDLGSASPRMGDVVYGVVQEIKEGGVFRAGRGLGVEALDSEGRARPLAPSVSEDLSRLFWALGFRGRPARELTAVLGDLIDLSSVDGGVFDLGSATYCMTRILTGQLDCFIDPGPRMIEVAPWVEERFRQVGKGAVLNNAPYDVAASALILEEAGCPVTDTTGGSLHERPLLGAGMEYQMAVVASANDPLHRLVLAELDRGLKAFSRGGPSGGPGTQGRARA
ncbi:MAG TPA: inositol monophosphatase family protein [Thermoleophilia bacterium]|nr:inositol monophosphatase family protein [Thermoleophilia bacterium]